MRLMDEANFAGRHLTHEQLRLRARGLGALIPDAMGGSTGRATDAPGIQMSRTRTLPLVALIAILSANTVLGEPHDPEVVAARTDRPPVIDGDLADGVWVQASPSADFRQREPEEGGVPSEGTEVRVLYDDRHLYFALRCFASEPERITAARMRRDGDLDPSGWNQIQSELGKKGSFQASWNHHQMMFVKEICGKRRSILNRDAIRQMSSDQARHVRKGIKCPLWFETFDSRN